MLRFLVEHSIAIDVQARVLFENQRERPRTVEPDFEPHVVEAQQQAVGGALRDAHREHARQAPAHGEVLVGIDQGVDQLADALLGDALEREHRMIGHRFPGEQPDHVRDERSRHVFVARQHVDHPLAVA